MRRRQQHARANSGPARDRAPSELAAGAEKAGGGGPRKVTSNTVIKRSGEINLGRSGRLAEGTGWSGAGAIWSGGPRRKARVRPSLYRLLLLFPENINRHRRSASPSLAVPQDLARPLSLGSALCSPRHHRRLQLVPLQHRPSTTSPPPLQVPAALGLLPCLEPARPSVSRPTHALSPTHPLFRSAPLPLRPIPILPLGFLSSFITLLLPGSFHNVLCTRPHTHSPSTP